MHEENYHHEEVVEIMVSPPGWGLKWGNIIISVIVLMIFGFAYFFNYPDTLKLAVDFSSTTSVNVVQAPAANYGIDTFLVKNGAIVKQGAPLLVWYDRDHSSYTEISQLENILLRYQDIHTRGNFPDNLIAALKAINVYKLGAFNKAYQLLVLAGKKQTVTLNEQVGQVLIAIDQWKKERVSKAEITGEVTYNSLMASIKNPIAAQSPVIYIQPLNAHYIARGQVGNKLFGEIKVGQRAYVTVNELTNKKVYGYVAGISPLANHARHDVYMQLDQSQGLNLTFTGDARIILRNRTLLQRLFNIQ
jgi:hypothetical protein